MHFHSSQGMLVVSPTNCRCHPLDYAINTTNMGGCLLRLSTRSARRTAIESCTLTTSVGSTYEVIVFGLLRSRQ